MDKQRTLYLVAYDVCDPRRLYRVSRYLTGYKVGGQKSVFEIWATEAEQHEIRDQLERLMLPDEDRLHILALDSRMMVRCKGRAHSVNGDSKLIQISYGQRFKTDTPRTLHLR